MSIKIKQKKWMERKINYGVTWMGAIKLGLFNPALRKLINKKVELPKPKFLYIKFIKN